MSDDKIARMTFSKVYPLYVQKAERKSRTKEEVDEIVRWLTGYDQKGLDEQIKNGRDFEAFFRDAPAIHKNSTLIKALCVGCAWKTSKIPWSRTSATLIN